MRILICSLEAPLPPVNGFRLHLQQLTKVLAVDHEVRVLALRRPDQPDPATPSNIRLVEPPCRGRAERVAGLVRAVAARRPPGVDRAAALLAAPVREELQAFDPDVVHVTPGRLALLREALGERPRVLAALDAWHLNVEAQIGVARGPRRILLGAQAALVRRFEGTRYGSFGAVVVVSEEDRGALLAVDPRLNVVVVPNGVDADAFAPGPREDREPDLLLFTGVMSYAPNVAAAEALARRILPVVRTDRPEARLAIVGRDPAERVRELASLDGVEVTGEVPDLRPWLRRGMVYVCPMVSGTGIKNKLLEAMASGLGCVATPLALRGLRGHPQRVVAVGTSDGELAAHAARLLREPGRALDLGSSARAYVLEHHAWSRTARDYEAVYRSVIERGRAS